MRQPFRPVGYLVNEDPRGLLFGERGQAYDYILAGNGVFIEAQNPLLAATVKAAPVQVRGLEPYQEKLILTAGLIPAEVYATAFDLACGNPEAELYLAVVYDGGRYRLHRPEQETGPARVKYQRPANTVMDIHSHGRMTARFSRQDDEDEQGLGLYMVFGRVGTSDPEVQLRLGVYGYYKYLELGEVFHGL